MTVTNQLFRVDDASGNAKMFVSDQGNVGIGTGTPLARLHVDDTNASGWSAILRNNSETSGAFVGLQFNTKESTGNDWLRAAIRALRTPGATDSSGDLAFLTRVGGGALTERMRMDSNGKVGIGTTTPTKTLDVAGQIRIASTSCELQFRETSQTLPLGLWRIVDGGGGAAGRGGGKRGG